MCVSVCLCIRYSRCPENCSGNGLCLTNGTCRCNDGWIGDGCSLSACPNNCSYPNGSCQSQRSCICDDNHRGKLFLFPDLIQNQSNYRKMSIKRRFPNNSRVSNKRWGFEANVLINAGSQLNAGSHINARVF